MILFLPVYMRAILKAASLASVPLVAKKNLSRPSGSTSRSLALRRGARVGGVAGRDVGQFAGLLGDGLDDAGILVAEVDAHELRAEVEVALAGAVSEPAALGVGDVERLPGLLEAPGAVVGLARKFAICSGLSWVSLIERTSHGDVQCVPPMLRHWSGRRSERPLGN